MTDARRILQVGTHSTLYPIHGGQLRSHNIGRVLEDFGHIVRGIAVCWRQPHDIDNDRETIIDMSTALRMHGVIAGGIFEDYFQCNTVADDPTLRAKFFHLAEVARPDAVLLEHPWLWPLVKLIPQVANGTTPVVYDSQNVEAHLKRRIVDDMRLDRKAQSEAEAMLPLVEALELDLVVHAAAVTACTAADAAVYRSWGARRTVVAGNGSKVPKPSGLRNLLPSLIPMEGHYALMVGSAHPPNITGFENLVLPWISTLRPLDRVVVAGGAADWLKTRFADMGIIEVLKGRLVLLGWINDLTLSGLIENAACIMLPIEYGGGSNIKTAEALLSDRHVVASPASMRGFSEFRDLPGLTVADGPIPFGRAVLAALADGSPTPRSPDSVKQLTWDAMLAPLVALIDELTD